MSLVGVYTSPGRWGAHYTTVHYPPGKKIGSVCVQVYSIVYFSLAIYNVKAANDGLISMGSR